MVSEFENELRALINKHSMEQSSETPDFILAEYLNDCLLAFGRAVSQRDRWYSSKENAPAED